MKSPTRQNSRVALILVTIFIPISTYCLAHLTALNRQIRVKIPEESEVMYLPKISGVSAVSLGYKNVAANFFWFKTISYFGKHFASDKNYKWLNHMCHLVVTLDPKTIYPYQFCANMLSWEAQLPQDAISVLTKGIEANSNNWLLLYLRGFTYHFFLKDVASAKNDFVLAAKLPNVHPMVIRLAAKSIAQLEGTENSVEFLKDFIQVENDPVARAVLEQRLKEILAKRKS